MSEITFTLWIAGSALIGAAVGAVITLIAYHIGSKADRLSKLIDQSPKIITGITTCLGSVRDMMDAAAIKRRET